MSEYINEKWNGKATFATHFKKDDKIIGIKCFLKICNVIMNKKFTDEKLCMTSKHVKKLLLL